jgi:predicted nucleic-acid-binding Zn-ribbon protein
MTYRETSPRNKAVIVKLGDAELEERGALLAADWPARVDFIEDLMCAVSWSPATGKALSRLWGLSPSSISLMAGEASRRVLKAYREAPDEVVARLCAGLDHVVQVALNREKHVGCKACGSTSSFPDPDCSAAIKGQVALAQILGLAPNRHDMELKYETLADDQLLRTILRGAATTPHLRPILVESLREMQDALLEAEAGAPRTAELPAHEPPAEVRSAEAPSLERPVCACGHAADAHYLLRSCWRCGCLNYSASSA